MSWELYCGERDANVPQKQDTQEPQRTDAWQAAARAALSRAAAKERAAIVAAEAAVADLQAQRAQCGSGPVYRRRTLGLEARLAEARAELSRARTAAGSAAADFGTFMATRMGVPCSNVGGDSDETEGLEETEEQREEEPVGERRGKVCSGCKKPLLVSSNEAAQQCPGCYKIQTGSSGAMLEDDGAVPAAGTSSSSSNKQNRHKDLLDGALGLTCTPVLPDPMWRLADALYRRSATGLEAFAADIAAERALHGPFASVEDAVARLPCIPDLAHRLRSITPPIALEGLRLASSDYAATQRAAVASSVAAATEASEAAAATAARAATAATKGPKNKKSKSKGRAKDAVAKSLKDAENGRAKYAAGLSGYAPLQMLTLHRQQLCALGEVLKHESEVNGHPCAFLPNRAPLQLRELMRLLSLDEYADHLFPLPASAGRLKSFARIEDARKAVFGGAGFQVIPALTPAPPLVWPDGRPVEIWTPMPMLSAAAAATSARRACISGDMALSRQPRQLSGAKRSRTAAQQAVSLPASRRHTTLDLVPDRLV